MSGHPRPDVQDVFVPLATRRADQGVLVGMPARVNTSCTFGEQRRRGTGPEAAAHG
jgi:hypothetical protein